MIWLAAYWKQIAVTLVFLVAVAGGYEKGRNAADTAWKTRREQRDKADLAATSKRENGERTEERRRQNASDEERKRADKELAQANTDAANASAAGERLQRDITNLRHQLAGSETGRISAVAGVSAAKAQVAILLAQLLCESDKAAGEYAHEADRNYAAGQSCERTYGEVTKTNQPR